MEDMETFEFSFPYENISVVEAKVYRVAWTDFSSVFAVKFKNGVFSNLWLESSEKIKDVLSKLRQGWHNYILSFGRPVFSEEEQLDICVKYVENFNNTRRYNGK